MVVYSSFKPSIFLESGCCFVSPTYGSVQSIHNFTSIHTLRINLSHYLKDPDSATHQEG